MRKVIGGFLGILLLLAGMLWITKSYFFSIGYTQPLVKNSQARSVGSGSGISVGAVLSRAE